ncbi:leucine-rich repeat protein [Butyrivibrio sp. WCD2001]|uniref:leucine-rich repeat protein n=1 Tax=Butyrivibrio sp. WCD2001 TaxID=1280681 RepID=UPI00040AA250|nr:leucine-rich repeat domain-containing protein [Butyrivibrio sp. WCD2001]
MKKSLKALLLTVVCLFLVFSKGSVNAANSTISVTDKDMLGTWTGTYTGTNSGTKIDRKITLNVNRYSKNGKFSGTASIDDNRNGNYYFEGSIDSEGEIRFEGEKWRHNPSNFGFGTFVGTFGDSKKTISGTMDGATDRPFTISHTSANYVETAVPATKVAEYWTGEYDGSSGSTVVRRNLKTHITHLAGGKIQGVNRLLPSSKADSQYGATAKYYFKGTYDEALATFNIQGYEWIEYPASEDGVSNWSFVELTGFIDPATGTIIGSTDNGIWSMRISNAAEFEYTPDYREDAVFESGETTYYTYANGTSDVKTCKSYTTTLTIPDTIEMYHQQYAVIGIFKKAFYKNTSIRKVDGGHNLGSIGEKAFYKAKNLREVDFANAPISKIDKRAFYGCSNLKTVSINGDTLSKVGAKAFTGVKNAKVYVHAKDKKTFNKAVKRLKKAGMKKSKYKFVKH